jgi:hypothetical protein
MGALFEQLLLPAGMAVVRAGLVDNYAWFTHASQMDDFEKIKIEGLRPQKPCTPPDEVARIVGPGSENIVCLQPHPKKQTLHLAKDASMFRMATPRDLLPQRIGVDWSFGDWREALCNMRKAHPDWPIERLFLSTSGVENHSRPTME